MARIVVADDSASLLEIFGHILRTKGHEVYLADCRRSLFEQLYTVSPELIFMDVRFNDDDGRHLCLAIQNGPYEKVPIILMSATPQFLEDHEKYGTCGILEKPFSITQILELVSACLQGKFVA